MGKTGKTRHGGRGLCLGGEAGQLGLFGTTLQWSQLSCFVAPSGKRAPRGRRRRRRRLVLGFLT